MRTIRPQLTIFCIGFFGLLAQTLLFRVFLTVFQGNELSAGIFFFSWLIWLIVGAIIGWLPFVNRLTVRCFEFCLLIYLPAFLLQQHLLFNTRDLLGIAEYEVIPFQQLSLAAGVFNAPVSIVTGWLLVTGANWLRQLPLPTARVYVIDAVGGFAGAAMVTLLLYFGTPDATIFPLASAVLCFIPLINNLSFVNKTAGIRTVAALLTAVIGLGLIAIAANGAAIQQQRDFDQWRRMLPEGRFMGSFATPQARYLFGDYRNEFTVVRWDGVCENFPNRETALEIAASSLAQNPDSRNILVIGSGAMSLCLELCRINQIERVVWLDADPDYPATVRTLIPGYSPENQAKLITPRADIRAQLRHNNTSYDLVLLLLPPPSDLAMNRYFSRNFFGVLKTALAPNGVIGVNFPGGENFISSELRRFGGSLLQTIEAEFAHVILKPGESARFYATNKRGLLSVSPEELQARLSRFSKLTQRFPPENFYTVFDPFRLDFQMDAYRRVIRDAHAVSGSDQQPLLTRFALQQLLRRIGGGEFYSRLEKFCRYLLFIGIVLVALVAIKRTTLSLFRKNSALNRQADAETLPPGSDIIFMVWFSSVIGMSMNILLMFIFQITFGSLFLYFGLLNALFMLGLFIGGKAVETIHQRYPGRIGFTTITVIEAAFILLLLLLAPYTDKISVMLFLPAFLGAGCVSGAWLPQAAHVFSQRAIGERTTSLLLWLSDSLGGALAGIPAALLLLPSVGVRGSLLILLAGCLPLLLFSILPTLLKTGCKTFQRTTLSLLLLFLTLGLNAEESELMRKAAQLAPDCTLVQQTGHLNQEKISYFKVEKNNKLVGHIFLSKDFANNIKGFRGPISILILIDPTGKLKNFSVLTSQETPYYLNRALKSKHELVGKNCRNGKIAFETDAISSATYTAKGIVDTLNLAGKNFIAFISGKQPQKEELPGAETPTSPPPPSPPPSGGARDINSAAYRKLIDSGRLANHKAQYAAPLLKKNRK